MRQGRDLSLLLLQRSTQLRQFGLVAVTALFFALFVPCYQFFPQFVSLPRDAVQLQLQQGDICAQFFLFVVCLKFVEPGL